MRFLNKTTKATLFFSSMLNYIKRRILIWFYDKFTDTNGVLLENHTPTDAGTSWAQAGGETLTIEANKAQLTTPAGSSFYVTNSMPSSNYFISCEFRRSVGAGGQPDMAILARYNDLSNHWRFIHDGTAVRITEVTASVVTARAAATGVNSQTEFDATATLNGTDLSLSFTRVSDSQIFATSYTSASHQAEIVTGIYTGSEASGTANRDVTFDEFKVTSI